MSTTSLLLESCWFVLISLLLLLVLLVWHQRHCWYLVWALNGWRGVWQQPLLWLCLLTCLEPQRVLARVSVLRNYFPGPLAVIIGTRCLLYVDDPFTMEQIFNAPECVNKSFLQDGFFAHKGLLHAKGEKWKIRRKQLNPCFNQTILLSFFDVFNDVGNKLLTKFTQQLQGDSTPFNDVEDMLSRAVLEVSCRTTMGSEMNFVEEEDSEGIASTHKKLLKISAMKIVKPWLQIDLLCRLLSPRIYATGVNCNKLMMKFVHDLVLCKYAEWKKQTMEANNFQHHNIDSALLAASDNGNTNTDNVNYIHAELLCATKQKRIFIEQIFHLAAAGELTLQQIMDESQSMVLVSFETVSNNIVTTLMLLAMHPSVQTKLRMEINDIVAETCSNISASHLQKMRYLDAVVNEALRLLTTVPMNLRQVSKNVRLKLTTRRDPLNPQVVLLPKDSIVLLDVFNMQREPLYWGAAARQFDPERHFMAPNDGSRHAYAYAPFSKGIRTCIGWRYSIMLTKIFLVKLIKVLEFHTETQLKQLRFVEGISLKILDCDAIKFNIRDVNVSLADLANANPSDMADKRL